MEQKIEQKTSLQTTWQIGKSLTLRPGTSTGGASEAVATAGVPSTDFD